ncbi:MAG: hypothetical protein BMS9Abin01_1675 [Gammaproteobacteria bacterium]|nr:MAG: hypothetical protein BMS9Abin01_1675 [Gammaproteobacteria bacterium]
MSKTPSAVIFDMDGVLCRYHFEKRLARLSEMTGVAAELIDDTETYIQGAATAGLLTHHFRSAPKLRLELEAYGLLS